METKQRILVVDDEEVLCEVLKINLELSGYVVDYALSAEEALRKDLSSYSLLILDVMMGEMSGFELASKIKNDCTLRKTPIILCTAKDQEGDVVEGFSRGVDDYIRKPFSMKELVLRVKSVLRRYSENDESVSNMISYKNLIINNDLKTCEINGEQIQLTKKEFDLIFLFLKNPDKIFSREEILDKVWEDDVLVIDRTIDVNINRLRKKLGEYGNNIITKTGHGYGFKK